VPTNERRAEQGGPDGQGRARSAERGVRTLTPIPSRRSVTPFHYAIRHAVRSLAAVAPAAAPLGRLPRATPHHALSPCGQTYRACVEPVGAGSGCSSAAFDHQGGTEQHLSGGSGDHRDDAVGAGVSVVEEVDLGLAQPVGADHFVTAAAQALGSVRVGPDGHPRGWTVRRHT